MKTLIENSILVIEPSLAKEIGLNEAIFLRLLHYWLEKAKISKNEKKWVFNSFGKWREQLPFFCERTVKRTIDKLKKMQLIEIKRNHQNPFNRTNFYTINYEELEKIKEKIRKNSPILGVEKEEKAPKGGVQKIDFKEFIEIYPKKTGGIRVAKREFDKLSLENQKLAIKGAKIYANEVKNSGIEDKFVKNPKSWLKEGYFEDYKEAEEIKEETKATSLVETLYSKILFLIKNNHNINESWKIKINNQDFFSEEEREILLNSKINFEGLQELESQKGGIKVFLSGLLEDGRVS